MRSATDIGWTPLLIERGADWQNEKLRGGRSRVGVGDASPGRVTNSGLLKK
jgi:hypothetical protein